MAEETETESPPKPSRRQQASEATSRIGQARDTVTRTVPSNSSRTIAGLVFFATAIALVSEEVRHPLIVPGAPPPSAVRIVLGGTVAGTSLVLLSHAGEPGRQFAVGLATVLLVSSALVYGAPFWKLVSSAVGSKPTAPTKPTSATHTPTPKGK